MIGTKEVGGLVFHPLRPDRDALVSRGVDRAKARLVHAVAQYSRSSAINWLIPIDSMTNRPVIVQVLGLRPVRSRDPLAEVGLDRDGLRDFQSLLNRYAD